MNRVLKLIVLIILSLSVYFIYNNTSNQAIKILNIGDGLSLGINSYGIKEYSYIDYYKDYLTKDNKDVTINNTYSKKDILIKDVLDSTKNTPKIKRDLTESHQLILNLGYNDLIYKMSITPPKTTNQLNKIIEEIRLEYNELIKEIRKYYKNEIIVIGYFKSNEENYYKNLGVRKLNNLLKENVEVNYVDTYNLLKNREKYFQNPNSYYPNTFAYQAIAKKIIDKTLEK